MIITPGDMPKELKEMLKRMFSEDDDDVEREALFMMKDHPEIQAHFDELAAKKKDIKDRGDKLVKEMEQQLEFFKKQIDNAHKQGWENIENLMKQKGLHPVPDCEDNGTHLQIIDGAMFWLKKKEKKND